MLIDHLRREFAVRSQRNPRYSLRAFSRSLNLDSSTLSALLRNKRPLSAKMARRLLDALNIADPSTRQKIFAESFGGGGPVEEASYTAMDQKAFEVIAGWEHFAILAVLEISLPHADLRSIARALNLPIGTAMNALDRLESLGLVQNQFGRWKALGKNLTTPTDVPNAAVRHANKQYIEKALEALENDPLEVRDISGITMAIDIKKLGEAKKRIAQFRRELSSFLENGKKTTVYRMNVQLFPLSR